MNCNVLTVRYGLLCWINNKQSPLTPETRRQIQTVYKVTSCVFLELYFKPAPASHRIALCSHPMLNNKSKTWILGCIFPLPWSQWRRL